jgi:hypothetical protein
METIYLQDWKFALEPQSVSKPGNSPFEPQKTAVDPWSPSFDDNAWKDIVVPHDWAVSFPFSTAWSSGTGYLPGGTGWYRVIFRVPAGWTGETAFLYCDGVYKNSQIWCNGQYLGKRPSGYTGFRYDISHCLREGDNVIAVRVSHEDVADSRWYTGSGIYRAAYIRFYDRSFIDENSLIVQSECHDGNAAVHISGNIRTAPETRDDCNGVFRLTARLDGKAGKRYSAETAPCATAAAGRIPFAITVPVSSPERWSPDAPNLYTLVLELWEAGRPQPVSVSPPLRIGIRDIRFDPDRGFFLNGKSLKMKGVCVHHDAGCLGAAVWPEVWRRRLEKLKAAGCNAIRTSHNPHMRELYALCDEMGFLVMDEAFDEWEGCKNKWSRGHNVYPPVHQGYAEDFPRWHEEDLAALVIRDRNHPSVIMWSIGNEIDYPNDPYVHPLFTEMTGNNDANKPRSEMAYNPGKPNMERIAAIAARLVQIVKKHDNTRPVLTAAAFPELSSQIGFFDSLDIVGYNYKEQCYETDHRRFPRLPILGSENGHSVAAWKAVRDNEYISAQFLWTGIDFLGEAQGWPVRGSGAGLLDLAGNEKIAWYRRKAIWSEQPVLYLATRPAPEGPDASDEVPPWKLFRAWDYAPGQPVQVICYTNLAAVELLCNGNSRGRGELHTDRGCVTWTIPFERGILRATDAAGGAAADALESTLPAARLHLREWKPATAETAWPTARPMAGKYRVAQIEAALLDEAGRLCAAESRMVEVSLAGPGAILGLENGDIADCSEYAAPRRRLYRGRLIIYTLLETEAKEPVTLTAAAEGLPPAAIALSK